MADALLDLYNELAMPYLEVIKSNFYQGSTVLDIFLKKKATDMGIKDLTQGAIKLPTYTGYEKKLFVDNDIAFSDTEAVTDIWKQVGDEINPIQHKSSGITGQVLPATINVALTINRTKLQLIEDLFKSRKDQELKRAINQDLAKYNADLKFGLAWGLYNGLGGDDPSFATYNANFSYPITLPDGTTVTKPSRRQIEGIYTFVANPNVTKLYGIDTATEKFYKPQFFDFYTQANYPFGYDAKFGSGITKSSELMASTDSMTAGVPVVIDILSQVIRDMSDGQTKPELILCRRDLFNVVVRAMKSTEWSKTNSKDEVEWLTKIGYKENIVIDGVPILPDDTKRKHRDGTFTYACPSNAFVVLNLSQFEFEAHKDYNFIETKWEKSPTVIGQFIKQEDATVRFSMANRDHQALIQFGDINYKA